MKIETKHLSVVFFTAVAGIVFCFGMTVYTAVQKHRVESQPVPLSIPTPAM